MDKQIMPADPRQIEVDGVEESTTAMVAGRKTMHGSWGRKTMHIVWGRKTMNHAWVRKTMIHQWARKTMHGGWI